MSKTFNYVHNQMGIPHDLIVKFPSILNCRKRPIIERNLYLKFLNRAQYDPKIPLYVPLSAFYSIDDSRFCFKYAKTSVNDYNVFLKTL